MDLEALYSELDTQYTTPTKQSIADKIEDAAEKELYSYSVEEQDRVEEEKRIRDEVVISIRKLRRLKNIKGFRHRSVNKEIATKRSILRKDIALLKLRLNEIADERKA